MSSLSHHGGSSNNNSNNGSSSTSTVNNNNNNNNNNNKYYYYRYISFDILHPGLSVRVMGDSNYMLVLDFLSVLTGNDRKKASQTLARVSSKPETHSLLTLRRRQNSSSSAANNNNKTPKKLISFSNAIQLLLVLPKRTVDLQTRRSVAGILADFFEATTTTAPTTTTTAADTTTTTTTTTPPTCAAAAATTTTLESVALKQALLQIEQQTTELEHMRRRQPLDNLRQCFDLLQQCGPLSENELSGIKRAVSEQMVIMTTMKPHYY
jgi:hypothetical protein